MKTMANFLLLKMSAFRVDARKPREHYGSTSTRRPLDCWSKVKVTVK